MMKKGRGRGFTSEVREPALRRPGQPLQPPASIEPPKHATLINLINNLDINKPPSDASTDDILCEINVAKEESTMNDVFCSLHRQAMQDRRFGIKLAMAVSNIKINSTNDRTFRNILLSTLQRDYERYIYSEPEDFKKKNSIEFRNLVSFMGEVSNRLKIGDQPIRVLNKPLLHYLQLLLDDSEEEDIELVTSQISMNGSIMHESLPDELEDFITRVKKVLINRNLSAKSRAMLLLIVDIANHQYAVLPTKLQEFYSIQLSLNNFNSVYRHEHQHQPPPVSKIRDTNDSNDSAQNFNNFAPLVDNNTSSYPLKNSDNLDNSASNLKKSVMPTNENRTQQQQQHPVPRAIRGVGSSGAASQLSTSPPSYSEQQPQPEKPKDRDRNLKKSPKGKKDNNGTESWQASKSKGHNKGWGHDDRFEKDYS